VRIVKVMYFDEPAEAFDRPLTAELKGVVFVTAVLTLFFFALPGPIVGGAEAAAAALFAQ
jgi:NADH-quinone oxidoreductase subunit N